MFQSKWDRDNERLEKVSNYQKIIQQQQTLTPTFLERVARITFQMNVYLQIKTFYHIEYFVFVIPLIHARKDLQIIAFCFYWHFTQHHNFYWIQGCRTNQLEFQGHDPSLASHQPTLPADFSWANWPRTEPRYQMLSTGWFSRLELNWWRINECTPKVYLLSVLRLYFWSAESNSSF